MKQPVGYVPPRHLAKSRKKVRLNLQRQPKPDPEGELDLKQQSTFWRSVVLVALFHLLVIALLIWYYEFSAKPKPAQQFFSLLPEGDVVHGTPGTQQAHKLGPTTAASVLHHSSTPPPAPVHPTPPKPVTPPTRAIIPPKPEAPSPTSVKPARTPPKPKRPKPVKVKVDLKLQDAPSTEKAVTKPKHVKKPAPKTHSEDSETHDSETSSSASTGLSKEKIAQKLGEKMEAAGIKNATKTGPSGSANSHANSFADFYASIRDQVMSQWESPNLTDETAINPIVEIHVEKDGRVPPESVHLIQSSGNPTYDGTALAAAKNLGYLHEPLPNGCPPDIPITFKLTR